MKTSLTGRLIAHWRVKRGLSQTQLADRLHVTRVAVSQWESGETAPRESRMSDIVAALELTSLAGFYGAANDLDPSAAA